MLVVAGFVVLLMVAELFAGVAAVGALGAAVSTAVFAVGADAGCSESVAGGATAAGFST